MPFQLYNTLTKRVEPFRATDPSRITFYTCGPTVYDDAHIGNFRAFLAADLLRRWLESPLCTILDEHGNEHTGPRQVRHVMNITDVGHMTDDDLADGGGEDKMARAAKRLLEQKKAGTAHTTIDNPNDPRQIAAFYTERFLADARKLGLKVAVEQQADPTVMPHASDNIEGMKRMIEQLAEKGFAYRVGDAVYFDVQKYSAYGELSGNTLDKLKGGAGGRVDDATQAQKRHPADFLLWKSDPSHLMKWPGPTIDGEPMPEGYPGWHIECSVMARNAFGDWPGAGDTIDLHSGGEDNIFPHHECERAQSCCATGRDTFARHWFHTRFLMVEGEKMSKSKGNFFTARDLFAKGHDPAAVRLELIKTHYMSQANFTEQGLRDSAKRVKRWQQHARQIKRATDEKWLDHEKPVCTLGEDISVVVDSLQHDLNMSEFLGKFNVFLGARGTYGGATTETDRQTVELLRSLDTEDYPIPTAPLSVEEATKLLKSAQTQYEKSWAALHLIDNILGVIFTPQPKQTETDIGVFTGGLEPDPAVVDKLIERRDARTAKDFATSDRIRDELAAMGYAIKDIAGGKVEVSRL
ncbi:MAG: cysteine--tRNA ligase [Phycisphaerales bacterium]